MPKGKKHGFGEGRHVKQASCTEGLERVKQAGGHRRSRVGRESGAPSSGRVLGVRIQSRGKALRKRCAGEAARPGDLVSPASTDEEQ